MVEQVFKLKSALTHTLVLFCQTMGRRMLLETASEISSGKILFLRPVPALPCINAGAGAPRGFGWAPLLSLLTGS